MAVIITKLRRGGPPLEIGGVGSIILIPIHMRRGGPEYRSLKMYATSAQRRLDDIRSIALAGAFYRVLIGRNNN